MRTSALELFGVHLYPLVAEAQAEGRSRGSRSARAPRLVSRALRLFSQSIAPRAATGRLAPRRSPALTSGARPKIESFPKYRKAQLPESAFVHLDSKFKRQTKRLQSTPSVSIKCARSADPAELGANPSEKEAP